MSPFVAACDASGSAIRAVTWRGSSTVAGAGRLLEQPAYASRQRSIVPIARSFILRHLFLHFPVHDGALLLRRAGSRFQSGNGRFQLGLRLKRRGEGCFRLHRALRLFGQGVLQRADDVDVPAKRQGACQEQRAYPVYLVECHTKYWACQALETSLGHAGKLDTLAFAWYKGET